MAMDELLEMAWTAHDRAYAPYSNFQVGAALETKAGKRYGGCNAEVANYGCTLCAERTAIVKAVSEGDLARGELDTIVIAVEATQRPVGPCGSCRQMIEEFAHEDTRIYLSQERGKIAMEFKHRELLPHAFGPSDLEEK